jgi:hypothetical protein
MTLNHPVAPQTYSVLFKYYVKSRRIRRAFSETPDFQPQTAFFQQNAGKL